MKEKYQELIKRKEVVGSILFSPPLIINTLVGPPRDRTKDERNTDRRKELKRVLNDTSAATKWRVYDTQREIK